MIHKTLSAYLKVTLITLVVTTASWSSVIAQNASKKLVKIPDPKFLSYLKEKIPNAFTGDEMDVNAPDVLNLTRINVHNRKVVSFEGIGYFKALEEFNCTYNLAAELDLSKNTKLKYLVCWENRLTRLDLSANTELLELNCGDNQITVLNVSKNKKLRKLYCDYNAIANLDLSGNKELLTLYCSKNKLTSLDLSKNLILRQLENTGNDLREVVPNPLLVKISDSNFRDQLKKTLPNAFVGDYLNTNHNNVAYLRELDISSQNITSLQGIEYFRGLELLNCADNKLQTLDLSKNTLLVDLSLNGNPLSALDLRGMRFNKNLSDLTKLTSLTTLKLHRNLREDASIAELKRNRAEKVTLIVFGAASESVDYQLMNSNDIARPVDNKY